MSKILTHFLGLLVLIALGAVAASCASMNKHGHPLTSSQMYKSITAFTDSTGTRTVVLVPMIHIAKPKYYKQISDYLDTLRAHEYVTFCEGVMPSDVFTDTMSISLSRDIYKLYHPVDSMKVDTLLRKMRKIMGFDLDVKYERLAVKLRGVYQPEALPLKGDRDYWVDETYADFIREFETRYGEIELSQYDFECPLDSRKYHGKKDRRWEYIRISTNCYCQKRLEKCVLESNFDKVAVVYGASHIHRLYWFALFCKRSGYKKIDNPYYQ